MGVATSCLHKHCLGEGELMYFCHLERGRKILYIIHPENAWVPMY